jgi:hypothetical protein
MGHHIVSLARKRARTVMLVVNSNPLFGCTEFRLRIGIEIQIDEFRCFFVLGIGSWNRWANSERSPHAANLHAYRFSGSDLRIALNWRLLRSASLAPGDPFQHRRPRFQHRLSPGRPSLAPLSSTDLDFGAASPWPALSGSPPPPSRIPTLPCPWPALSSAALADPLQRRRPRFRCHLAPGRTSPASLSSTSPDSGAVSPLVSPLRRRTGRPSPAPLSLIPAPPHPWPALSGAASPGAALPRPSLPVASLPASDLWATRCRLEGSRAADRRAGTQQLCNRRP